jgi:hypothetical protein
MGDDAGPFHIHNGGFCPVPDASQVIRITARSVKAADTPGSYVLLYLIDGANVFYGLREKYMNVGYCQQDQEKPFHKVGLFNGERGS